MATRVRTAAIWVPPLQEQESSCNRIREFRDQESILGPGAPRQRPRNHRTEQVLEWLFISHEQPKPTQSRVIKTPNRISSSNWSKEKNCGCYRPKCQVKAIQKKSWKLMIIWTGIRKIKASWKVWQKTMNVLHLENYVFLVQIMILQDKSFINTSLME
ncbi:uncharacterized protein LOC122470072 isoform X2 [Prionailurus bengalensis]|uniref:uncharacterized protein LOC122470072 isoform X2 n=1 Tax=Prionailurus bengalensis TaxID=37029 RepID=UPI001CA81B9A|nr:uncharacterized protein LOC122470072 isoform X2 [Prionailurus bengalensis]